MEDPRETIRINARVEITTDALGTIVENARLLEGRMTEKPQHRMDTADMVGEMISRFLYENDFDSYVQNLDNYPR